MTAGVERWDARNGPLREADLRSRLEQRGYTLSRYVYPPGTVFPDHTHAVDKIDAVVSGRFRLVIEGTEVVLGPGDFVEIPKGVLHSAAVVGHESVVSLDAVRSENE